MGDAEGFQVVRGKRAGRRRVPPVQAHPLRDGPPPAIPDVDVDDILRKVAISQTSLLESPYPNRLRSVLCQAKLLEPPSPVAPPGVSEEADDDDEEVPPDDAAADAVKNGTLKNSVVEGTTGSFPARGNGVCLSEIVCYGLGNISVSNSSRLQLAALLYMRDRLLVAKTLVYDPMFSAAEREALGRLGLEVLSHNERGKRVASAPVLLYMPHCGKALCNNLLWTNWSPSQLARLYIIGNSFSRIVLDTPSRILTEEAGYLVKASVVTREVSIGNDFHHQDVFNDTSLHWFPPDMTSSASPVLWESATEPVYGETVSDIILT